jgi:DNA helicase II / ATP-dependent DNA helicase PcrA
MRSALEAALGNLTDIQRQAVEWGEGPLLVLAGPGSGKTQVLTCRIARLLDASREKNFRILAMTFTNKAADEMKGRVSEFVPDLEERANIGTFHSFCAQVLRQHGVHLGINPDFAIYTTDDDRKAVLDDALRRAAAEGNPVGPDDLRYLSLIDRMKARLIDPASATKVLTRYEDRERIAVVYDLYESELRRLNALDFNSLIFEAHRLATAFPALTARYRTSHPYWLIDEFQDTNTAQYRVVRAFAGNEFRNVFAVADDDQILYQWNGASFKQIQSYLHDFAAAIIQLPTNYRCPPAIVDAANRLVAYNAQRTASKTPLVAAKMGTRFPPAEQIQVRVFKTDKDEATGIAREILGRGEAEWGKIAVLARTRSLLDGMQAALREQQVPASVAQRRDQFLSAHMRWLVAVLYQAVRPLDRRNIVLLTESFNRVADVTIPADQVIADAETTGRGYLATWLEAARAQPLGAPHTRLLDLVGRLAGGAAGARPAIDAILEEFASSAPASGEETDLAEDMVAWRELSRDIASHLGRDAPLEQFLQALQLRSKEPTPKPHTVRLMTIHGAKGTEFDIVYLIGLAEDLMPSFQSRQKGDRSPEMEEERRNCFVAITRTKECLVLSRAERYRGWVKKPSRFLVEMQLAV